jgi:hypothetical protein
MKSVRELFIAAVQIRVFSCKGGGRIVAEPVGPFLASHYVPKAQNETEASYIGEPHSVWLNPHDPRVNKAQQFIQSGVRAVRRAMERGIHVGG